MGIHASPMKRFYQGRRILVTGDTGFKGSWLAFWLDHLGAEVHGLALEPDTDPSNFEILGLRERVRPLRRARCGVPSGRSGDRARLL
jgi:nucleoside-diphosphate-sugar epimerase